MLMDAFFLNCGLLVEDDFDLTIWYHDNMTGSILVKAQLYAEGKVRRKD